MQEKTKNNKTILKTIISLLLGVALFALAFVLYKQNQNKTIQQDILPNNYRFSIEYDAGEWSLKQIQGNPKGNAFGYYASAVNLYSTKTYKNNKGESKPIYEIRFRFEKNINAFVEAPSPGSDGWTGADNTKPEKPLPFKKDDFEYVTTVNGKRLYIAKDGDFTSKYLHNSNSFLNVSIPLDIPTTSAVAELYPGNTISEHLDIFSSYEDVFNGLENFAITYRIASQEGSWQELKPELIKILKSMKVEKVK